MTITDTLLNETAKALNNESYGVVSYFSVGTSTDEIANTADTLPGEIGPRVSVSRSRTDNAISLTAVRLGNDVIDTGSGDLLQNVGTFLASTGDNLTTGTPVNAITHTTAFDIEMIADLEVRRA